MKPPSSGPDHGGDDEGGRRVGLVARAVARRGHVADDGLRERHQPAAAEPLQRAGEDQHQHGGRQRAGDRARRIDADRDQHHGAPAVDVGELAEQRRRGGGAEQVRGHHPGHVVDVAEVGGDGRQRGRDHHRVERRQHHGEQDAENDPPRRGVVEIGRNRRRWRKRCGIAHDKGPGAGPGGAAIRPYTETISPQLCAQRVAAREARTAATGRTDTKSYWPAGHKAAWCARSSAPAARRRTA